MCVVWNSWKDGKDERMNRMGLVFGARLWDFWISGFWLELGPGFGDVASRGMVGKVSTLE